MVVAFGPHVLHGPETPCFEKSYRDLGKAGSTITAAGADDLASNAVTLPTPASHQFLLEDAEMAAAHHEA